MKKFLNLLLALVLAAALMLSSAMGDTIYVSGTSNGNGVIEEFTSAGVSAVFTSTSASFPSGLAFDTVGNLYVAGGNSIQEFTPGAVSSIFASTGLDDVNDVAFDHAGNLYAANFVGNSVITKITSGGVSSTFADSSVGLNVPYGLAVDSAGNLYASNYMGNTITKFTNGVSSQFANTGLSNPTGMAFDSSGNLYVANSGNNTIEKFTKAGVASVFASTGLDGPQGIAFDSSGNLYVANFGNNTIEKFTPAGVGSVFNSTLQNPSFIAISSTNINLTKIISLTGSLAFGPMVVNGGLIGSFTINNTGNTTMTVTSITYPIGFSGNWFGTIAPDGSQIVTVGFNPTEIGNYSGNATVNSDATSGTDTIAASGIGGSLPVITSPDSATFTVGRTGSFKVTASGFPAPTFSTIFAGELPSWVTLDPTTGILSGTPPDTNGAPFFPVFVASNGLGDGATQSFTLNVLPAPTPVPFNQWETSNEFTGASSVIGPTATPLNDGVSNLLKYLYDIDPAGPMSTTDRAALPVIGMTTIGVTKYLTLTFRENPTETGITISVQTSPDLQTWTTVTNPTIVQTGNDLITGDPIMQAQVAASGTIQFIRLNVTSP